MGHWWAAWHTSLHTLNLALAKHQKPVKSIIISNCSGFIMWTIPSFDLMCTDPLLNICSVWLRMNSMTDCWIRTSWNAMSPLPEEPSISFDLKQIPDDANGWFGSSLCAGLSCHNLPQRSVPIFYLSRLGAHTKARFRVCMLVIVLKVARWARCLVRYSRVLWTNHTCIHYNALRQEMVLLCEWKVHLKWGVGSSLMAFWIWLSFSWSPWTETASCVGGISKCLSIEYLFCFH